MEPRQKAPERAERDVESDRILAVCELQEEGNLMKLPLGSTAGTPNFSLKIGPKFNPRKETDRLKKAFCRGEKCEFQGMPSR